MERSEFTPALVAEFRSFAATSRAPRIRPFEQWLGEELVIPEGRYKGSRFRFDTLPWTRLWAREIDSGRWRRFVALGCVQGGKTLVCFVAPLAWHLFEHCEPVGIGLPDLKMGGLKWEKEIEPVIEAHPVWRELRPTRGRGSEGGEFNYLEFQNGASLEILIGGGGDANRSGTTLRVVVVTEADRADEASETSREAAPIHQMEARTLSFEADARFYAECTVTSPQGFVWQEYNASTASRIMCPHSCGDYVCPGREHLVGWQDAESALQAGRLATFVCPSCACVISEEERRTMNERAVLVHKGQEIDRDGVVHGEPFETFTLGFRWNAFNNLLWSTAFIGEKEWEAAHSEDEQNLEQRQKQWFWVQPWTPELFDETPLALEDVLGRHDHFTRGQVPPGTVHLTAGVDLRKTQLHYVVVAWINVDGQWRAHVVEYGSLPVDHRRHGTRKALRVALEAMREIMERGFADGTGQRHVPGWVLVDGNWLPEPVRSFVRQSKQLGLGRYMIAFGRGQSQPRGKGSYSLPTKITTGTPWIGEQCHVAWHQRHLLHAMFHNADHWKGWTREGLAAPADQPGAITIFQAVTEQELLEARKFAKQTTAERAVQKVVVGRGIVVVWENASRTPNHYGDGLALAAIAGNLCGVIVAEGAAPTAVARPAAEPTPATYAGDSEPYLITDRE